MAARESVCLVLRLIQSSAMPKKMAQPPMMRRIEAKPPEPNQ